MWHSVHSFTKKNYGPIFLHLTFYISGKWGGGGGKPTISYQSINLHVIIKIVKYVEIKSLKNTTVTISDIVPIPTLYATI